MKITSVVACIVGGMIIGALLVWGVAQARQPAPPAVTSATAAVAPQPAAPDRISVAEVQGGGPIVYLDVRPIDAYIAGHIPGALHIPVQYLQGELPYLVKDKPIITYCSCPAEESSGQATAILRNGGFQSSALVGGYEAWVAAGLPVNAGRTP